MRRAVQVAVQAVVPGVIRASNACLEFAGLLSVVGRSNELRAPVPADVIKATNPRLFVTDQQDTLTAYIDETISAFCFQALDAADAKPLAMKYGIALLEKVILSEIVRARQC
tara:strand:+ start:315 stop:650 length:336 start_codon:yes stop_codon:yes gene_type:complete